MGKRMNDGILRIIISILALGDGVLHLMLDYVLFRGNFFGPLVQAARPAGATAPRTAPPPGAPRPSLPLPLNEMFVLNFVGEVALVTVFLLSRRLLGKWRWLVDVVMIVYAATTFVFWWMFGRPNPMELGYISKGFEIVLIIALIVDIWSILRTRQVATATQSLASPQSAR